MKNEFELHPDRLGTTDAKGRRIFLHPSDVRGFFRSWRTRVHGALIVLFLVLPWIRIGGRQALLLDLPGRKFEIFGLSLRAHNAPLLILVLAAAAFGLFFVTAVFGRVWCGWACPQTVFIDSVFRRVERWIDGPALDRRRLDAAPWTFVKLRKRACKWSAFVLIGLVITHSFLAYFIGTEKLAEMVRRPPAENPGDFFFMIAMTMLIVFDFSWFREQFCTIVCPYGRFQSVLMDKHSMVVAYDAKRGEPRATPQMKALAKTHGSRLGDCVNCYRCVQVCPTGIDIRRGVQMECIACTACIDACDDVMKKIEKPLGLIRYDSTEASKGRRVNARSLVYLLLTLVSLTTLSILLFMLKPIDVEILRAKNSPYSTIRNENGDLVVNHFKFEISNQSGAAQNLEIGISDRGGTANDQIKIVMSNQPFTVANSEVARPDVFIHFPRSLLTNGQKTIRVYIKTVKSSEPLDIEPLSIEKEVTLVGPFS